MTKANHNINFLPQGREGGGILPWVIAVMAYLSALSIASGFAIYNLSSLWSAELSENLTIQISHPNNDEVSKQAELVLQILNETPEVTSAHMLSDEKITDLLEPWLGSGNVTDDLPIPAMITAQVVPNMQIDLIALEGKLNEIAPDAKLDGNQQWVEQLSKLSSTIQATSAIAVILIMLTTVAIIVFATHARLASHRDNIEIVHLMGADDDVIAREFRNRFMIFGLKGGLGGVLAATITVLIFYYLTSDMGGGITPKLSLNWLQLIVLACLPLIVSLLAMTTANKAVKKSLTKLM